MVIYGAVTSVRNTRANLSEFAAVEQTRIVMIELQRCLGAMVNLEAGQRGYLLTGRESFLEPYRHGITAVDGHIAKLRDLTLNHPARQDQVEAIREAADLKMLELERAIAAMQAGDPEAAAAIVATGRDRELMDRFRSAVSDMQFQESELLAERQKQMIRSFKNTNTVVVTTGVVAIVAGVVGTILLALFLMVKERQEHLQFEKEKAVQADKAKTDFLAMMSHEIRTPMNAILGFGELLHGVVDKPQEKHFAKAIITSGNSLLSLINDILDLSKIEAAKMELHPEAVEMKRFTENLETLFSYRAQEKGLDYGVRLDPEVPPVLTFDALRLRQVLVNLIGNAIKFTREGSVDVAVQMEKRAAAGEVRLRFEVTDTGIGISGDQITEIFRPFYQVGPIQGRGGQGTGLGLSICERLVALMGGRIWVESVLGQGSVFHVEVPVERRKEPLPEIDAEEAGGAVDFNRLAPSKILIVDDVPLNRELIRGYLHGSHHQVLEAENGEQAVTMCHRHMPDLVLMDIRMPAVDGPTALTMLKAREATKKIPLVALTASSLLNGQEDLKRIFDGFASKPISRERLYLELAKFLPVPSAAATLRPQPEKPVEIPAHGGEWPDLQAELGELRDTILPNLIELVPAQATLQFAKDLSRRAEQHHCPPLAAYAGELRDAAANMDFTEAGRVLARFPGLIDSLADANV